MINSQPNKYMENSIQTASPAQLLLMLYDGGIRFCKLSIEAIKQKDYIEAGRCLGKTQDIINEFIITLDHTSPLAEDLVRLYDYFLYRLIEANVKKDIGIVQEVMNYLIELKDTWAQASKQLTPVQQR